MAAGAAVKFAVGIVLLALSTFIIYSVYGFGVVLIEQVFDPLLSQYGTSLEEVLTPAQKQVLARLDAFVVLIPVAVLIIFVIATVAEVYRKSKEGEVYYYEY